MATEHEKDDQDATIEAFKDAVNMSAGQIDTWLDTDESKSVGQKKDDSDESIGHQMGRRIVEILGKKKSEYSDDDVQNMRKVVSYVHRHLAQRPDGDIGETNWRYSLMNWGHDPSK